MTECSNPDCAKNVINGVRIDGKFYCLDCYKKSKERRDKLKDVIN